MSEETLEISYDQIEKEREKYLLVDTRDKVTIEYGMIPGAISVPEPDLKERAERAEGRKNSCSLLHERTFQPGGSSDAP